MPMRLLGAAVTLLVFAGGSTAGTITGTIKARGVRDPRNVVVYIEKVPGATFSLPERHAVMDQVNLVFVPHVLPVLVGTTVDFPNSDKVRHNVFTPSRLADRFNLGTYPTGVVKSVTFRRPGAIPLLCNVHAEMSAYIIVLETPYFAVTGPGGTFRISDVPGGRYELKTWHEALRPLTRAVEVPAEGEVAVTFELSR